MQTAQLSLLSLSVAVPVLGPHHWNRATAEEATGVNQELMWCNVFIKRGLRLEVLNSERVSNRYSRTLIP
jgi:hypothetical protein